MLDPEKRAEEARAASFAMETPADFNFAFDVLDRRAATTGGVAVIAVARDQTRVEQITYQELALSSGRLARSLAARGLGPRDRAFVMMERVASWHSVIFGCLKAGVTPCPATNLLGPVEIAYRLKATQATVAFVSHSNLPKLLEVRNLCPQLKLIVVDQLAEVERDPDVVALLDVTAESAEPLTRGDAPGNLSTDEMMIFFTSGTSAHPKAVVHCHGYALAHYVTGRYWMDLRPGDIHWTLTDTGWAKAAWGLLFPPILCGATMVLYDAEPKFDAEAHLSLIGKLGVTCLCAPPTAYRQFAALDLAKFDLRSLRHSTAAGEPLNPEVIRVWEGATGTTPHDGYGQTETINIVANQPGMRIKPGSMGKATPGNEVEIVGDDGTVLADHTIGHIAVKVRAAGAEVFKGYGVGEKKDRTPFKNGWYFTGDLGRRDEDGYLWFVGRADDIITSAGYRISPFEVESALVAHPAVKEAAVVGVADPLRGQRVRAHVLLTDGYQPTEELARELQVFVKTRHSAYAYPREIIFEETLPKTVSGKIRRNELRARAE